MGGSKYFISYFVLAGFVAAVLAVSILIALTSSLGGVQRSNCDNSRNVPSVKNNEDVKEKSQEKSLKTKRYSTNPDYLEKMEKLKEHRKQKSENANIQAAPSCSSLFTQNVNGTLWQNPRLQTNVMPTRYNIEFYLEYIFLQSYNGQVNITLGITEDLNTIILHSHLLDIYTTLLRDNTNNLLAIQCADYYPGICLLAKFR